MPAFLRTTLAQINPCVGDIKGNTELILSAVKQHAEECDVIVFPELCLTGYPPEDLLLRTDFIDQTMQALSDIARQTCDLELLIIVGHPALHKNLLFNAASVIQQGDITDQYHKRCLPNYKIFDEKRYFKAGKTATVISYKGANLGLIICEDVWEIEPIRDAIKAGSDIIIVINASPFHYDKAHEREQDIVRKRAREFSVPIIYVNQIGGQDELVFDGNSLVVDCQANIVARLPAFEVATQTVTFTQENKKWCPKIGLIAEHENKLARTYQALILGVRDYVNKNNFKGVVLGLSGGIDSALTLAIAVDALGAERVHALMMPYQYTSQMSLDDAHQQAAQLGVQYDVVSIAPMVESATKQLSPLLKDFPKDATEENIQARCRMVLLMAISNKKGLMVLTTGNKSEMAVGYATLYGDMAGGFSAIKDVPKTMVYDLANYRNTLGGNIPKRVITRPPSAELRPDQTDQDSLPDYDILDAILMRFVELDQSEAQIINEGFNPKIVNRVIKMVVRNEYKRRQAAPGVRISPRAFGRDRRYPITSKFFI